MKIGSLELVTKELYKYNSIVIFHHIRPDGGLFRFTIWAQGMIKLNFPDKKVYAIGDAKNTFDFLDFTMDEVPSDDIIKKSLAVVVDANHKERIRKKRSFR
ncbi:Bifunctional oligoribonuclease and PAP phosphatase nrnA (plasmid) [Mycoplasmopsis canis]|uniref:Bifunctional oligoribonuclease and PAP phosphatase nrnA n=1 Tax=Mycoplasmopsis canis TaxID=29555 RepID=A0A449ARP6_9BACT|nr:Bifunctional oligoribonuclease and PAP phosphatase nrnA [Mycoplasmopsis canis]